MAEKALEKISFSSHFMSVLCLAAPLLPALWLFWPCLTGDLALWGTDLQTLGWPMSSSAQHAWSQGEWPLWVPEILGGVPGLASSGINFLYPIWLLFTLLHVPVTASFGYEAFFQVCFSAWGCFLFARLLGVSRWGALASALAYAFSGTQTSLMYAGHTNNVEAYALIPWAFWGLGLAFEKSQNFAGNELSFLGKLLKSGAWLGWVAAAFALALQILGVGMQIFAYTILVLPAFVIWLNWAQPWKKVQSQESRVESQNSGLRTRDSGLLWVALCFVAMLALTFCLAAPQLLPSMEYHGYSWRDNFSYKDFTSWSFPPWEALQWLVPGFFGWRHPTYTGNWDFCLTSEYFGLLPWALAFAAVAAAWKQRKGWPRFFVGLFAVSFVIGIGKWTPLHYLFYHLPVYQSFRSWTRFLCFCTFSICMLAGLGWDALTSPPVPSPEGEGGRPKEMRKDGTRNEAEAEGGRAESARANKARRGALVFTGLALAAGAACWLAAPGMGQIGAKALAGSINAEESLRAKLVTQTIQSSAQRSLLFGLLFGLFFLSSPRLRRGKLLAYLLPCLLLLHLADVSDMLKRYVVFQDPGPLVNKPDFVSRLPDPHALQPYRIYNVPGVWQPNQSVLYGLESVEGYHGLLMAGHLKLQKAMQPAQQEAYFNLMGANFFIGPQALGDAWLKPLYQEPGIFIYQNPSALGRAFWVGSSRLAKDADEALEWMAKPGFDPGKEVVLLKGLPISGPATAQAGVQWLARSPNHFELQTTSSEAGYLVISQSWYPHWQAWVDGKPEELLQADAYLQAIALPAGNHQVTFRFDSPWLWRGFGLMGLGLLLVLALGWQAKKQGPSQAPPVLK